MRKNVVILTHGWTGSSVYAGLLGAAGYWLGAETFRKADYDTFENLGLVEFNQRMLDELGFTGNYEHEFTADGVLELERRAGRLDLAPYRAFVESCGRHAPWAWKDPRLTWTMRQWRRLLPMEKVAFIVLTRDDRQAWISSNLRRHVQSVAFTQAYNHGITRSNLDFLAQHRLPHIALSFEDLLLTPEATLDRLNAFLDTQLGMDDLRGVFRGKLFSKVHSIKDYALANLIYWKNYGERDGRMRRRGRAERTLAAS